MEWLVIFSPLMCVGLDWLIYLGKVWWAFTGKKELNGIKSPVYDFAEKQYQKTGNGFWGEGFYPCGFVGLFGFCGSFILLLIGVLFKQAGIAMGYVIGVLAVFAVVTYGTRAIRTLFSAVKAISKVAHKHENGEVVNVDIPLDTLTREERDIIDGLVKKVKR